MARTLIAILICVMFAGCASRPVSIKTETQEVLVPVTYCPAPVMLERPHLPIQDMTTEQQLLDGEVVKHYKATIRVLIDYAQALELQLKHYAEISETSAEIRNQVEAKEKLFQPQETTTPE